MTVETIDITDISQDPANVRKHSRRNLDAIKASLRAFGQQKPIVVDDRNVILAGNGTYEAAKELGWSEIQIVRTQLTGTSAVAYAIADNRTAELAEWDDTALAEQLRALQSEEFDVEAAGFTGEEIDKLIEGLGNEILQESSENSSSQNQYTQKIDAPIYTPKGERPSIDDLTDRSKEKELCEEINKSELSDDLRSFLLLAAKRHVVFNFRNIAEFYCHASAEVQHLMERSGLIIIDFNKAIQNGFVHLSERLAAIADLQSSESDDA